MKGIAGYIIIFGIIIALQILIFSTFFHKDILRERSFMESYYLTKGSQLDTYVKAYLSSLQSSLLQAIYDAGCKKDEVWERYENNLVPGLKELENEIKEKTELYSNIALKTLAKNEKNVGVPKKNEVREVKVKDFVSVFVHPLSFKVERREINISYTFSPNVEVNTSFKKIYDKAKELISGRKIEELVRKSIEKVKDKYGLKNSYSYISSCDYCPGKTCEELFREKTGYTLSDVEEFIREEINQATSSFSYEDYFLRVYLYPLLIKSKIEYAEDRKCEQCAEDRYREALTCYYSYFGAGEVLVNVTENPKNYFNYTIYDRCEQRQVVQNNLRLNFRVIDGNAKLI